MADPVWPASLPQKPALENWNYTPQPNVIRFQPDVGPDIARRRMSAVPRIYDVTFPPLTAAQLSTFETFFETTLYSGAIKYTWADPVSESNYSWRILKYSIGRISSYYELSMQVMRLP